MHAPARGVPYRVRVRVRVRARARARARVRVPAAQLTTLYLTDQAHELLPTFTATAQAWLGSG